MEKGNFSCPATALEWDCFGKGGWVVKGGLNLKSENEQVDGGEKK